MKFPKIQLPAARQLTRFSPLVILVALSVSFPASIKAEFAEEFQNFRSGQSLYTKESEWRKYAGEGHIQPKGNTAIVRSDNGRRHLAMVSHGHETANARAFKNVTLPVSGAQNNKISGEIRFTSPDVPMERPTGVLINLNANRDGKYDTAGALTMGIFVEGGEPVFFFSFGSKTQGKITSRPDQLKVNPEAWYRFHVELDPGKGRAEFAVYELAEGGDAKVWSGSNEGLSSYTPQEFYQVNLIVTRPGKQEYQRRGADFANIRITQ